MAETNTAAVETRKIRPYYESSEKDDAYEVRVWMPGVNRSGINISLENDELNISGKRASAVPAGWRAISRESGDEDYELRLALNVEIDGDKIEARTEDGILCLTLPKAETVKPRRIAIQ